MPFLWFLGENMPENGSKGLLVDFSLVGVANGSNVVALFFSKTSSLKSERRSEKLFPERLGSRCIVLGDFRCIDLGEDNLRALLRDARLAFGLSTPR